MTINSIDSVEVSDEKYNAILSKIQYLIDKHKRGNYGKSPVKICLGRTEYANIFSTISGYLTSEWKNDKLCYYLFGILITRSRRLNYIKLTPPPNSWRRYNKIHYNKNKNYYHFKTEYSWDYLSNKTLNIIDYSNVMDTRKKYVEHDNKVFDKIMEKLKNIQTRPPLFCIDSISS